MSTIDIRQKGQDEVTEIIFADDAVIFNFSDKRSLLVECKFSAESVYVNLHSIDDLIAALQKAQELMLK